MWDVKTMAMSLRISNKHGILQYKKNGHSSGFINEHAQHAEGKGGGVWLA